jgi:hypothetical protein
LGVFAITEPRNLTARVGTGRSLNTSENTSESTSKKCSVCRGHGTIGKTKDTARPMCPICAPITRMEENILFFVNHDTKKGIIIPPTKTDHESAFRYKFWLPPTMKYPCELLVNYGIGKNRMVRGPKFDMNNSND